MNKLTRYIMACLTLIVGACLFSACGSSSSPVDSLVKILDEASEKIETAQDISDIGNMQNSLFLEDVEKLIEENKDYKLTHSDKEKLKKSYDKLVTTIFNRSSEILNNPNYTEALKSQVDMVIANTNANIDNSETLGDIKGIR